MLAVPRLTGIRKILEGQASAWGKLERGVAEQECWGSSKESSRSSGGHRCGPLGRDSSQSAGDSNGAWALESSSLKLSGL